MTTTLPQAMERVPVESTTTPQLAMETTPELAVEETVEPTMTTSLPLTIEQVPGECIACDGGCGATDPEFACLGCFSYYYCSRDCQKKHWKSHKHQCKSVRPWKEELERATAGEDTEETPPEARNPECIICMEEFNDMDSPDEITVLEPCRHAFCNKCIFKWQRKPARGGHTCPICRASVKEVEEEIVQRARICYYLMLQRPSISDPVRAALQKRLNKALWTLNTMGDDLGPMDLRAQVTQLLYDSHQGIYDEEVCEEFIADQRRYSEMTNNMDHLLMMASAFGIRDREDSALLQYQIASGLHEIGLPPKHWKGDPLAIRTMVEGFYRLREGDYNSAITLFERVKHLPIGLSTDPAPNNDLSHEVFQRSMLSLAYCYYQTKQYDSAIRASNAILPGGRHLPGVYFYKALSLFATEKIDEALLSMNRAVLYEAPWDSHIQERNLEAYNAILECSKGCRCGRISNHVDTEYKYDFGREFESNDLSEVDEDEDNLSEIDEDEDEDDGTECTDV